MIYQDILTDGRGYGKPHVVWIGEHGCWRANYRGCYAIDFSNPWAACCHVKAFYKSHYPNEVTE